MSDARIVEDTNIEDYINLNESSLAEDVLNLKVCIDEDKIINDLAKAEYSHQALQLRVLTDINLSRFCCMYIKGVTTHQLATEFGISPSLVSKIKCTPEFKKMLSILTSEVSNAARMLLTTSALKATNTLVKLLDSDDEKIQLGAAKDILDRMGVKADAPSHGKAVAGDDISNMSEQQLKEILKLGIKEFITGD